MTPDTRTTENRTHVLDYRHSRIACSCGRWKAGTWAEHQRNEGAAPPWPEPVTKAGRKLRDSVAGEHADAEAMGWWSARIIAIEEEARSQ